MTSNQNLRFKFNELQMSFDEDELYTGIYLIYIFVKEYSYASLTEECIYIPIHSECLGLVAKENELTKYIYSRVVVQVQHIYIFMDFSQIETDVVVGSERCVQHLHQV